MWEYYGREIPFEDLVGKIITSINSLTKDVNIGIGGGDELKFVCEDGSEYVMYHSQSCCEHVYIEDVSGDLDDLIGTPILLAEMRSSRDRPEGYKHTFEYYDGKTEEYEPESETWTFYCLRTIKGTVDLRWLGTSNGYYGEEVNFAKIK